MAKIPVGISECLLGEPVRFDGGHKRDSYLTDVLSKHLDFHPVCPEVTIGLGVPRQPIRIVATDRGDRIRRITPPAIDVTDALGAVAEATSLKVPDLCGYIFMQNSPSCGVFAVKRFTENGRLFDTGGQGAYVRRLTELMPLVPMEEAGRLKDAQLRDSFLTRVFAFHDWKHSVSLAPGPQKLLDFYSRYKYLIMAHHLPSYAVIGKFLADVSNRDIYSLCNEFIRLFMTALGHVATPKSNTNTMMHLQGYLKHLSAKENKKLTEAIIAYKSGSVPLQKPLALMQHHLSAIDNPYLKQQTWWSPYPEELGLRP